MTDSNNGVSLMQSGDYDGGSFSGDATSRLMAGGIVAPVNTALIPNYANVFEGLKNKTHNSLGGVPYGVPHGRGPNLLMYNTDVITTAPTSWDAIWEGGSAYAGKISVYDSSIYIADAALHLMKAKPDLGIKNPYQLNDAQFTAAVALLEQQRDNGALYWGTYSDQVASYAAGDVVVGTSWQFQVGLMQAEGSPIAGVVPDEGSTGWSDTWMIAAKAKNPNCMYMWMDHMASAEANGQATVWFGESPTSQAACDYAETLSPGHCELTHATDEAYYSKIWYWSTPQADCADTDAATTCKDQDAWVAAWTALRGA
jgi:putative spermidine/putrescine transport system substrate-binding protein